MRSLGRLFCLVGMLGTPTVGVSAASAAAAAVREVRFSSSGQPLRGYLCRPDGAGPFAVVVYLHGGRRRQVAGDPSETVRALARLGYLGFAPIRRSDPTLAGHLTDTQSAIDFVKRLPAADPRKVAVVGFSRGALLACMASTRRRDLAGVAVMAPARGRGALDRALDSAAKVSAATLVLVARNDLRQTDHVRLSRAVDAALRGAGKESELKIYPPFGRDGHRLFFRVRRIWWGDVERFLSSRFE